MPKQIPIAIVGATGYTGIELVRLCLKHPNAEIVAVTSRQHAGQKIAGLFPFLAGQCDLTYEDLAIDQMAKRVEAVFLCLPHHESMEIAAGFRKKGTTVLDLSADFRLNNAATYEKWYGPHTQKGLLKEAVYGLPEFHREEIKKAKLVAVPGCYPTSIQLGLAPLLKKKLIETKGIICDSKSGTSGAGRTAKADSLFCEVHENFKAYKVGCHRHTPEMEQELSLLAGEKVTVLFAPHLLPIDRGIFSTIYCEPKSKTSTGDLIKLYQAFYKNEPFVKVLPEGTLPSTKNVRGTNFCHVSPLFDERTGKIVVLSAIDNLTKGASGQAVQCFNLIHGFPEETGLTNPGFVP
ncbi:MAG: N-acetyl-gamma-glutamyl-phosphate reductase [Deltaproteobacteria bacterium]|nr:N-acetyl-gamma-glutamyl-phosphate reductase [Deltaproteobacteria bacterium]